jgi:hypothetical protein
MNRSRSAALLFCAACCLGFTLLASLQAGAQTPVPDSGWLKDEQGREYRVEKVQKDPARYQPRGENQVLTRIGGFLDIVGEDEQFYHVKRYRPAAPPPASPTPAQAAVPAAPSPSPVPPAAGFRAGVPQADRIRFEDFGRGLPDRGQWRNGFAVADMNGDGHADIVHGPPRKRPGQPPYIFLGDGQGNWKRWAEARFPPAPYDYGAVAAADFDGDGVQDLALAFHLRGLMVLRGDGQGLFEPYSEGLAVDLPGAGGSAFSSRALLAADMDADGKPDVVALGEGPRLTLGPGAQAQGSFGPRVYRNLGQARWQAVATDEPSGLFGDSIAVGDFDGDGRLDVAIGSSQMGADALVHLGQGEGRLGPTQVDALPPRAYVWAVAAADLDRDGRADLILGSTGNAAQGWQSSVDVIYARPDGAWQRKPVASEPGRAGVFAVAAGDLDADGALDVVALTGDGEVWVFLGDGRGFLVHEESPELANAGGGCRGYHVELRDLDGKPGDELVAAFAGEAEGDACTSGGAIRAWRIARP